MPPRGPSAVSTHVGVTQSYKFIRGDGRCRTLRSVRSGGQGREAVFFPDSASGVDSFSKPSVLSAVKYIHVVRMTVDIQRG